MVDSCMQVGDLFVIIHSVICMCVVNKMDHEAYWKWLDLLISSKRSNFWAVGMCKVVYQRRVVKACLRGCVDIGMVWYGEWELESEIGSARWLSTLDEVSWFQTLASGSKKQLGITGV